MANDAISRSALINGLKIVKFPECKSRDEKVQDLYQSIKKLHNSIIEVIETEPALDAVPVVRCGDCKWYDSAFYACSKCGVCVNRDFYCADGEKEG